MTKRTGKHPEKALSAVTVRNAKPGRHADGNGLYLEVDESGARRWLLRIMIQGKRRDIGLGSASLVTLAEARDMAHDMRKIARAGGDPLADRRAARRVVPTFEEAAKSCHGDHKEGWKNEKHAAQWLTTLETYVFPLMGAVRVNEIGGVALEKWRAFGFGLCSSLEIAWAFVAKRRMSPHRIIEPVDVASNGDFGL